MAHFVLVAGAWHGAWSWELIVPELEARGHSAQPAELPGMGADRTPLAGLGMMDWARAVARVVEASAEPVILVGHSRGGVVISQVAELVPSRIRLGVYLTAIMLSDGETGLDVMGLVPPADIAQREFVLTADGLAFAADTSMLGFSYANSGPELIARAMEHLTPEPLFGLQSPVSLTPERYGSVRRAYIECLEDQTVTLPLQRAMQARQPCDVVRAIPTDHCPNYSAPGLVADTLDELARLA